MFGSPDLVLAGTGVGTPSSRDHISMDGVNFRWDPYELVEAALHECRVNTELSNAGLRTHEDEASRAPRLVVICIADKFGGPAMSTAHSLEAVRAEVEAFAQCFCVEAIAQADKCWDLGVVATPAVLFFWDGEPVSVRRPDWDDDTKLHGAFTPDKLLEVIRHTRDTCLQPGPRPEGLLVALDW